MGGHGRLLLLWLPSVYYGLHILGVWSSQGSCSSCIIVLVTAHVPAPPPGLEILFFLFSSLSYRGLSSVPLMTMSFCSFSHRLCCWIFSSGWCLPPARPQGKLFQEDPSTGWGLWKKPLQEGTPLHTSAAPGGSHFHGSPHLVSMNLLQILAKYFHQHIWCLPQVGNVLGPVSPCRLLPTSDFELLGCLMTSVLWWAQ